MRPKGNFCNLISKNIKLYEFHHKLFFLLSNRLTFGDSLPFLSLVAVNLASGNGVLTKEDELEGLCWEIRVKLFN